MRGTIKKRSRSSYTIILDEGRDANGKRRQRWIAVRGTKADAEKELNKLVRAADTHEFIRPSKRTLGEWLIEWLQKSVRPSKRRRTYATYAAACSHLTAALGTRPLQAIQKIDVESYFSTKAATLSSATLHLHRAVLSAAFEAAIDNNYVNRNPVTRAGGLPPIDRTADVEQANVLDVEEARKLLAAAAAADPRRAAFYALALDSGARLGELCGLQWNDLDLTARKVTVRRQLISSVLVDGKPEFGPTKTGRPRTVDLSAETVRLLAELKRHQAELLLKNRITARSFGLVFSQESEDLFGEDARVGDPLQIKGLGKDLRRLLKAAGVTKRITFHGLRHTSATLLLVAGENPKVVSERLGHRGVEITLNRYSHLLPSMGRAAADRLGALLHG